MDGTSNSTVRPNAHLGQDEVERLAAKALRALAARAEDLPEETPVTQLYALTDAYIDPDEDARHDMLTRIMGAGVSSREVVESVVPATARYMGELWANDRLSFAEVTIGAARLQETVRSIGSRKPRGFEPAERPSILLVVPRAEQHTLGIFVLAEQFRRLGAYVHLVLGSHPHELVRVLRRQQFAMVGISSSGRRSLASVRDLVKTIRTSIPRVTPIVVGGTVTELDVDIRAVTGADHVTSDPKQALELCHVPITSSALGADRN